MNITDREQLKSKYASVMRWYPFGTDEPHTGDRALSDDIVVCAKPSQCSLCHNQTVPRTVNRVRSDIYAGEIATYRWCQECCDAMLSLCECGDEEPLQERYRVGEANLKKDRDPCGTCAAYSEDCVKAGRVPPCQAAKVAT